MKDKLRTLLSVNDEKKFWQGFLKLLLSPMTTENEYIVLNDIFGTRGTLDDAKNKIREYLEAN